MAPTGDSPRPPRTRRRAAAMKCSRWGPKNAHWGGWGGGEKVAPPGGAAGAGGGERGGKRARRAPAAIGINILHHKDFMNVVSRKRAPNTRFTSLNTKLQREFRCLILSF